MRKKAKYEVGDRVSFVARQECTLNGNLISGVLRHKVGYIKQVRNHFWGVRYVVCVSKSDELHVVPEHDIFGKVERKERQKDGASNQE